jgi:hypothetical protein
LERPVTLLLLALSGASLLQVAGRPDTAMLALSIVALALVRPLCWGLTGPWRQAALGALPLSPLAIPLAMLLPAAGALGVATAVAFVLCEAAWSWMARTPA